MGNLEGKSYINKNRNLKKSFIKIYQQQTIMNWTKLFSKLFVVSGFLVHLNFGMIDLRPFEFHQLITDKDKIIGKSLASAVKEDVICKEKETRKENQTSYTLENKMKFVDPSNFWKEWIPEYDNVEGGTMRKQFSSNAFGSNFKKSHFEKQINELLKEDLATWRTQYTTRPYGKVFNFNDKSKDEQVSLVVSGVTGKWSIFLKDGEKVLVRHGCVSIEKNSITHTTWEDKQMFETTINTDRSAIDEIREFKVKTKIATHGIRQAAYFEREELIGYFPIKSVKFDTSTTKYRVEWDDGSKENVLKNENELLANAQLEVKDTVVTETEEQIGEIVEILENEKTQKSYTVYFKNSNVHSTFTKDKMRLYEKNEVAKPHERERVEGTNALTSGPRISQRKIVIPIRSKEDYAEDFMKTFVLETTFSVRGCRKISYGLNEPNEVGNEKRDELKRKREEEETESTDSQHSKSTNASTNDDKTSRKLNEISEVGSTNALTSGPRRSQRKIVKPIRYEDTESTKAKNKRKI